MNGDPDIQGQRLREDLFGLLPAFYRNLDLATGSPLRALTGVMQAQLDAIDGNVVQLYDDWFIETCRDWVAPYIGNLVGLDRLLGAEAAALPVRRALVADLIAFNRRKGTVHVLQPLAFSATGYPARGVEAWPLLAATQNVAAIRPGRGGTVDVSDAAALARLGTPLDQLAHLINFDASARGSGGLADIALFLWRLIAFPMERVTPSPAPGKLAMPGFWFDPLGRDVALFAPPSEPPPPDRAAGPRALPLPISRQLLAQDLAAFRARWSQAPPGSVPADSLFYGPGRGLSVQSGQHMLGPLEVACADLSAWQPPAAPAAAFIDPERGRLLLGGTDPVRVSYGYGLAAPIGGGPYERVTRLTRPDDAQWKITVGASGDVASLTAAFAAWAQAAPATALISILDSGTYPVASFGAALPKGGRLAIEAADQQRPAIVFATQVTVSGVGAALVLSGLLMQGTVALANATRLIVEDCTMLPPTPDNGGGPKPVITPNDSGRDVAVTIRSSIVGAIALPEQAFVALADSVVDAFGAACAIGSAGNGGPVLDVARTTVIGTTLAERIEQAANAIFLAPIEVADLSDGQISYSHVAPGSKVPLLSRCQPDLALADAASELGLSSPDQLPPEIRASVIAAVAPRFTSLVLPAAGFAQFTPDCPRQISFGAGNGGGMGAFNSVQAAQHERVLRILTERFTPVGRKVGVYFAT